MAAGAGGDARSVGSSGFGRFTWLSTAQASGPGIPMFQKQGHVTRGDSEKYRYHSRLEVSEDLLHPTDVEPDLRIPGGLSRPYHVRLGPQGTELKFTLSNGRVCLGIEGFACHQMVVVD